MMRTTLTAVLLVLGGVALGAGPPPRQTAAEKQVAIELGKMFPDGLTYDFGKVKYGTTVRHVFRVVNRSDIPLKLISLRSSSCRPVTACADKGMLLPNEEGKVKLAVNCSRFIGRKGMLLFLVTEQGKVTREFTFSVTGVSVHEP